MIDHLKYVMLISVGPVLLLFLGCASQKPKTRKDHAEVAYRKGVHSYADGEFAEAYNHFSEALKKQPNFTKARVKRGSVLIYLEKYEEAEEELSKAIDQQSNNPQAHNNRGFARLKMGRPEAAISDLSKAIELDKDYALPYYNRGIGYYRTGTYRKALTDLEHALNHEMRTSDLYLHRGDSYYALGKQQQALKSFVTSFNLNQTFQTAVRIGQIQLNLGNYDNALKWMNRAIKMRPKDSELYRIRSSVHEHLENQEKSINDLAQYVNLKRQREHKRKSR